MCMKNLYGSHVRDLAEQRLQILGLGDPLGGTLVDGSGSECSMMANLALELAETGELLAGVVSA